MRPRYPLPWYTQARLLLLAALVSAALALNALGLHSFATGVWAVVITYSAAAFAGGMHTDMARAARAVLPFLAIILALGVFAAWLDSQLAEAAVRFLLISYDQARALRTICIVLAFAWIGGYLRLRTAGRGDPTPVAIRVLLVLLLAGGLLLLSGARLPAVGIFLGGFWYATYIIAAGWRGRGRVRRAS